MTTSNRRGPVAYGRYPGGEKTNLEITMDMFTTATKQLSEQEAELVESRRVIGLIRHNSC